MKSWLHKLVRVSCPVWVVFAVVGTVNAHDVPNEIRVHAYMKPHGDQLELLVRVPLILLTSVNLPKRGPGYLDLDRIEPHLERAAGAVGKSLNVYDGNRRLRPRVDGLQLAQPSDESFRSFSSAAAHIERSLPDDENIFWNQGYFDVSLQYEVNTSSLQPAVDVRLAPGLSGRTTLYLRYVKRDGSVLSYNVHGAAGVVYLDPRWYQAAWTFTSKGIQHILSGIDHILFLICLLLPFRIQHFWTLVKIITAFTVAHSITLIVAATGRGLSSDWFPPLVEALIAFSIVYMAVENVVASVRGSKILHTRWLVAGLFGLVHGFGFAFVLREELQFAGTHLASSLLAFNVGIELGQIIVLAIALVLGALVFASASLHRITVIIVSIFVAHHAWHWLVERADGLAVRVVPAMTEPVMIGTLVLLGVLVFGLVRLLYANGRTMALPVAKVFKRRIGR